MTTQPDRFSTGKNDLVFVGRESDTARSKAFLKPFGVDRAGGTFIDASGYPLSITPVWTEGLDRFAAAELERAGQAIADPVEIRILWKDGADGSKLLTRRYLAEVGGVDVAVDVNRAGWRFATAEDPGFDLDRLKVGETAWPAAA